jgi:hypothetical protein
MAVKLINYAVYTQYLYRVEYSSLDIFDELDAVDGCDENGRSGEEEHEHKQHCESERKLIYR